MGSATPLNTELTHSEKAAESAREIMATEDGTIYEEMIAPLEDMMMRSIWRVVRDSSLAEDCLQDALVVIWRKRFQIRIHPNPRALILNVCLNSAYDSLRRLERTRRRTDRLRLANRPEAQIRNADSDLHEKELEENVQRAIRRLPRKRALAVMMRLIQQESFETIALALNCSEITARIHVSKGRAQLRRWLSPLWEGGRQEAGDA